jgi:hypothetical protein
MHITPHLHVVKDYWKKFKVKNTLNFEIPYVLNCEWFSKLGSRLLSSKFFIIKIMLLQ